MNSSIVRALSAHLTRSLSTNNTEGTAMKKATRFTLAAIIMAVIPPVTLTLTACGEDEYAGDSFTAAPLSLELQYPEVCKDAEAPSFCSEKIPITVEMDRGDDTAPYRDTQELDRSASDNKADAEFAPLPSDNGHNLRVQVSFKDEDGEEYELPSGYQVQISSGTPFDKYYDLMSGVTQHVIKLKIVDVSAGGNGSGYGHAKFVVKKPNGEGMKDCFFDFNGDLLDNTCKQDSDGATCEQIKVADYSIDIVTCENGTFIRKDFPFHVFPDVETPYTVTVYPANDTSDAGAGTGETQACVSTNPEMTGACLYTVGGVTYAPTSPPGADAGADSGTGCDGVYLEGIPLQGSATAPVCVSCENGKFYGCKDALFTENETTPVEVDVTDTTVTPDGGTQPDPTELCFRIRLNTGDPVDLANCTITDITAGETLVPETAPSGSKCNQYTDALYYGDVEPGDQPGDQRRLYVDCDEGSDASLYTIKEGQLNTHSHTFLVAGTPGSPCYDDVGDNVNVNRHTLRTQIKLGHFDSAGNCEIEADPTEFEGWYIEGITDYGDCDGVEDDDCLIQPMALAYNDQDALVCGEFYQHMILETTAAKLDALNNDQKVYHDVMLRDPDDNLLVIQVVAKNGTVSDHTDYECTQ